MFVHSVDGAGAALTIPNWFAALEVIEPTALVVRSVTVVTNPLGLSRRPTTSWSPEPMNRSLLASGVKVAVVDCTGLAGACATPSLVRKAKLTYSTPTRFWQPWFKTVPLMGSSDRLSMFSAAHHWVASQLLPAGQGAQPGG